MTVTVEQFRATFPVYSDPLKFPDQQIQFYLNAGYALHNPVRWGALLDLGVSLWTAHCLAMDAAAAAAGGVPGAIRGTVTSMSADGLSWSRDVSSALDPKQGHWNLSTYGIRWRALVNLIGVGPLYVGAPGLYDAWLSQYGWAWPGPMPAPGEGP